MARRITFVGVVRFTDRVLVAGYSPSEADDALIIKEPERDWEKYIHQGIGVVAGAVKSPRDWKIVAERLMSNPDTFVEPRKRYTSEGRMFSIHFVGDDENRVYSCVTDKEYPARIAFALLEEMQVKFITKVGVKSLTAREGSLSGTMKSSFADLCVKYEDIRSVDRMAAVQDKVDVVKMTMQDNIQRMLANEERLEQISENAENLNEQAKVFQNRSSALRRQMRCKAIKMWLLLALVVAILLIIIIVPLVKYSENN